jgi:hypothetical protein
MTFHCAHIQNRFTMISCQETQILNTYMYKTALWDTLIFNQLLLYCELTSIVIFNLEFIYRGY